MPIVMKKRVAKKVEFKVSDQKNCVTMVFVNVTLSSMYSVMDCLRDCEIALSKLGKEQGYKSVACLWSYCVIED